VHSIIYDEASGKASGVRVIDAETKQEEEFYARVVFVNGATLNSNLILLNSTSSRFPNGLGNDSGVLGRYIAFHNYRGNMIAEYDGFDDRTDYGDRPTTAFMPSFRNVYEQETDFLRGYMVAFGAGRRAWAANGVLQEGFGADWKSKIAEPGPWQIYMQMQGETIPKYENHVRLSDTEKDAWGIPQLVVNIDYDENDQKTLDDFLEQGKAMLEAGGCTNIRGWDTKQAPGLDIHEMGGIRMGNDPETSMLNKWNQVHSCKNVFVTDGACMTSIGNQNPSLTFMAISARAANYAAEEMEKGNL
jgi:choline dehydrogenase-like flavoprotein